MLLRRWDMRLFLLSLVLFTFGWQLDLISSGWFYVDGDFGLGRTLFFVVIYEVFGFLPYLLVPGLLAAALWMLWHYRDGRNPFKRKIFLFLFLSLLIGPGLLVNTVFKNNSIGRARPSQIVEFGGENQFTPAFVYSGACEKNCSFVSGHASMGLYFIALGWLLRSRRWFWIGLGIGSVVGLTRIVQGGHFLSDTVFAFWSVYWVNIALGNWLGIASPFDRSATQPAK